MTVPVAEHLVSSYRQLDGLAKLYADLRDQVRERIEAQLGDAETGTVEGVPVVRWAHVTTRRIVPKLVRDRLGDEADECYAVTMSRRFRVMDR